MKVFTRGPARPHARKARTRPISPSKWRRKMLRLAAQDESWATGTKDGDEQPE